MSLATRAAPVPVRRPAMAQLLLPASWRESLLTDADGPLAGSGPAPCGCEPSDADGAGAPGAAPRTFNTSGPGIPDAGGTISEATAAAASGTPSSGASHSVRAG